ncbi:hypothetical protein C8R41DRAFT_149071 [Lentinula lateritia]|uniref:Proteophosphoglycan ppg4 n=1 Tax=Lentinula lateritia TaxID=40482 RepID=A0ABQ8VPM6_9AGAR|nr:hypothetical protein C8R41DRAFT_149071 [Lentinula lateritia]
MAAPTQILPPWLSATEVVVDGQTETSLVFEPLTYFGPSIPLGSLFTFGGSTSPASLTSSTATPPSTSSSSATSTATPSSTSTSLPSSSSPAPSTSSSSTAPSSSSSTASSSSSSITPSSPTTPTAQSHGLERGQLIGVIIASILGFIFLFVLALFLYLWWNARRNRRRNGNARFSMVPPSDDDDLVIIPPGGVSPGEGSPRVSGEEADPFLRRQSGNSATHQASSVAGPSADNARQPPSTDNSVTSSTKSSSNSAASGYGTLLQNPSLGVFVPQFEDRRRNILSPDELRQFGDIPQQQQRSRLSTVGEQGELAPLTPPPRLVDVTRSQSRLSAVDRTPSLASQASDAGEATLLTARRVRAEDLGPRPAPLSPGAESSRKRDSGAWKGLGLGGLAAIGRLSWFQNITGSSSSRRNSRNSGLLQDRDIEAGRALLNAEPGSPPEMSELQGPRFRGQLGLGVGYAGDRPVSGTSANSRPSTIYHDAQSSLPGTPLVMPPPRAMANSGSAEFGFWPQTGTETASSMTAVAPGRSQDGQTTGTQSTSASTGNHTTGDVLDMPAPRGISPFASSHSVRSVREVGTLSSQGSQGKAEFPYPPGLTSFSTPGVWNETVGTTPSPGSFAAVPTLALGAEIGLDVLEQEPPSPGSSWRSMAGGNLGQGGTRRTTFGLFVNPPELYSEQGSLHSMRSHLSPVNSRSSGSASVSRREKSGSTGSASSRPSARSAARSIVSGSDGSGASLAHSNSISADDRRKNRAQPPMSPAFSVFGNNPLPASSLGHSHHPSLDSPLSEESVDKSLKISKPIAEVSSVTTSSEDRGQLSPRSPRSPLSSVPWAAGLDDAWSPS